MKELKDLLDEKAPKNSASYIIRKESYLERKQNPLMKQNLD